MPIIERDPITGKAITKEKKTETIRVTKKEKQKIKEDRKKEQ